MDRAALVPLSDPTRRRVIVMIMAEWCPPPRRPIARDHRPPRET